MNSAKALRKKIGDVIVVEVIPWEASTLLHHYPDDVWSDRGIMAYRISLIGLA